jgi:hypothetical protein
MVRTRRLTRRIKKLSTVELNIRRAIRHHKFLYYDFDNQIGGGRARCKVKEGIVVQNGFRYRYTCHVEDGIYIRINGGARKPCFVLMLTPDHRTGILEDVATRSDCSLDPGSTMKIAGAAAFQLAREYGITRIELTDNSTKTLTSGKRFKLSTMKFLTTGQTWYESFLPIKPPPEKAAKVEQWRNIVRTNTWANVYACLRAANPGVVIPVDISDIDSTLPGSAMKVYQRIKESNTDFFADYDDELVSCNGMIGALHGMLWIADV